MSVASGSICHRSALDHHGVRIGQHHRVAVRDLGCGIRHRRVVATLQQLEDPADQPNATSDEDDVAHRQRAQGEQPQHRQHGDAASAPARAGVPSQSAEGARVETARGELATGPTRSVRRSPCAHRAPGANRPSASRGSRRQHAQHHQHESRLRHRADQLLVDHVQRGRGTGRASPATIPPRSLRSTGSAASVRRSDREADAGAEDGRAAAAGDAGCRGRTARA